MFRRLLRSGPKYAIATIVVVVSVTGFGFWLVFRAKKVPPGTPSPVAVPAVVDNSAKIAKIEANVHRLILIDDDLYDSDTNELLFRNWLKEGMPQKLFYDGEGKRFIAQYPNGFMSYNFEGRVQSQLLRNPKAAFSDDYKWAVYAKDKEVWRADVDWKELKLLNEKKVTAIEQFYEQYFADNIVLGTEKTLVVRNQNKVLRVNLETGEVKPTRISLQDILRRRSPDSKTVIGLENGQFYSYDVDSDEVKTIPLGRGAFNDYQWLSNDKCVVIASAKNAVLYDRKAHKLDVIAALPSQCFKVGEPSPDGRFVFCAGRNNFVLVDLETKTAAPITGGAGIRWISNDTFAFSRQLPDSDMRGTWLQTAGQGERRVSSEPYLVSKAGGELMPVSSAGLVVFVTKHGVSRMKPDGSEVAQLCTRAIPPSLVLSIDDWKTN